MDAAVLDTLAGFAEKPTELTNLDSLPHCIAREFKTQFINGIESVQVHCGNCGHPGPWVGPVDDPHVMDFAFWLCNSCFETWGSVTGVYAVPDEVFFERVKQAQLEHDGRELSPLEVAAALKDDNHYLSKLARDRRAFMQGRT